MQTTFAPKSQNLESHLEAELSSMLHNSTEPVALTKTFGVTPIRSAVALPVYERDGTVFTRMTLRPQTMRTFPGEIVFAGGRLEDFESPSRAALREYNEELGSEITREKIVAELHPLYRAKDSTSCYEITPCVIKIAPEAPLSPSADEVAAVYDVPLDPNHELFRSINQKLKGATGVMFRALAESVPELKAALSMSDQETPTEDSSHYVITSGGTRVPIDAVRSITNESAGTTGALIAESALKEGNTVHYLCAKDAKTPFFEEVTFNFTRSQDGGEKEIERVTQNARQVFPLLKDSTIERVKYFTEYERRLMELCRDPKTDVVILSMAANDHAPDQTQGKISSDAESYPIIVKRLPKLISQVKSQREGLFLVGFKLLVNRTPDELVNTAYASMLRDKQDLAVANVGINTMRATELKTYIITGERGVIPVERDNLDTRLTALIHDRLSKRHFSTRVQTIDALPLDRLELNSFLSNCHWLSKLALFSPYTENARQEFGFVAQRTDKGTLITGRGSSKSAATDEDIALVTGVNLDELTLDVQTLGKKASLNASLAHLIFNNRPEVKYIVHAHISLPEAVRVARDSSPSTAEDWERMENLVRDGHNIIEQPNHGVFILLESLDEILPILERNSIYRTNAEHYDDAYRRFLKSDAIIKEFSALVPHDGAVLDLCSGTGEVTQQLLQEGFKSITLCDRSEAMNTVARRKLEGQIDSSQFHTATMEGLTFCDQFDGVIIRQAINYVAPEHLTQAFKNIGKSLKPGGILVFNSFLPENALSKELVSKRIQTETKVLNTSEGNLVVGNKIYHGQRTEIFDLDSGDYKLVYDLNGFWAYTAAHFEQALRDAGARDIQFKINGSSIHCSARWS